MLTLTVRRDPTGYDYAPIEGRVGAAARRAGIRGANVGISIHPHSDNRWEIMGRVRNTEDMRPVLAVVYVRQV